MKKQRIVEPQLYKIDHFIQQRKRLVTNKPVFTEVSKSRFHGREMAHLVSYPTTAHPNHYAIVYKTSFYNRNKNQNIDKLKRIGAHELAHIKVPHQHNQQFQRVARKLGAGKYSKSEVD